jgi:hypothetical protein
MERPADHVDPALIVRLRAEFGGPADSMQLDSLIRHGDLADDLDLWLALARSTDFQAPQAHPCRESLDPSRHLPLRFRV